MAYVSSGQPCGKLRHKEVFVSYKEQCEQGINVVLMPYKVLHYSREHNNGETYKGFGFVDL